MKTAVRFPLFVAFSALLIAAPGVFAQEEAAPPPSLAQFDEDVAVCRRVIRQYCAIVQDMMKEKELDAAKQAQGLALLAEARKQWAGIQQTYAANPPAEYAGYKVFRARLQDVANSAEDMERALAAGDPRRSMLACGYGCGLFVTWHEENGMNYSLDKLFHLRKTGKTAEATFHARGMDAVRLLLPVLLRQRDDVLLAPLPWPEGDARNEAYLDGVRALSAELDRMALATSRGDAPTVGAILGQITPLVNKPYGIAL